MDEDKDKRDMWRMLKDPDYALYVAEYKRLRKIIYEREKQKKEADIKLLKKLNKTLGKLDD